MALTTTAKFKAYIGKTDSNDDTLIDDLVLRSTDAIENHVDRTLTSATYREIRDGNGSPDIFLDNYPVTSITLLATSLEAAISIQNTSADAYSAYIEIEQSTLASPTMSLVVLGGDNASNNTITLTDHTTITALIVAIEALAVGWSVNTVTAELARWAPTELIPTTGLNATRNFVELFIPFHPRWNYVVDRDIGLITINPGLSFFSSHDPQHFNFEHGHHGIQNIVIKYVAGFSTTPADLEQIAIDLTKIYWDSRKTQSDKESEKIGDYSYKKGNIESGKLPESIKTRLNKYVRPSI